MDIVPFPIIQAPRLPAPLAILEPGDRIHRAAARVVLHDVTRHRIAAADDAHEKFLIGADAELRRAKHTCVLVGKQMRINTGGQNVVHNSIAARQYAKRPGFGHRAVHPVAVENPLAKRCRVTPELPALGVVSFALFIERLFAAREIGGELLPRFAEPLPLGQAQFVPRVQRMFRLLGLVDGLLPLGTWRAKLFREMLHLGQPSLGECGTYPRLQLGQGGLVGFLPRGRVHVHHRRPATGHDTVKCVVILLADRIEFVVVTARTRNREAKERLGHHVDLVLGRPHKFVERIGRREALQHKTIMRRADGRLVQAKLLVEPRPGQQITGDVLSQQLVVRHVFVQRANEVIPVLVGVRDSRVTLTPKRLRVAHPVHPMPRPALAKVWRGEQALNRALDGGPGVGSSLLHERLSLPRRGREPGDYK